ncbi:tetratricopeptide repeat protein [Pararhodobacter aggregans]|uniref:tetratricopeptide repeat protein n=1 Tax=Pararhodobacter aggregans TaxID=404875 RepID=UPI003A8D19D6
MLGSMKQARAFLNPVVAATLTFASLCLGPAVFPLPAQAQEADVELLLDQLADPSQDRWMRIERQILNAWGQSGSASVDYLFQRGEAALQAGQAAEAIDQFSAVLDYAPDFAEAWNGRATAYFLANRIGQSLADIEQVLRLNPRHFGALAGLGIILEQLERPEEALEAYRASLAIHPHQQQVIDSVRRLELASAGQSL